MSEPLDWKLIWSEYGKEIYRHDVWIEGLDTAWRHKENETIKNANIAQNPVIFAQVIN